MSSPISENEVSSRQCTHFCDCKVPLYQFRSDGAHVVFLVGVDCALAVVKRKPRDHETDSRNVLCIVEVGMEGESKPRNGAISFLHCSIALEVIVSDSW